MSTRCSVFVAGFGLVYLIALGLLLIGTFGLFGQEKDPLSGIFLLPLGLPWTLLAGGLPDPVRPWAAGLAPALNLALAWYICRRLVGSTDAGTRDRIS